MPFLRYKSGDRARWETCGCEFPLSSVRLLGRTDDMIVAGDMNLYGRIVERIIAKIPGSTGKVAIKIDKVRLRDRLTLQIEGMGIDKENVLQSLFGEYPEIKENIKNGNLTVNIETGVDLSNQIKELRIFDLRFKK